MKKLIGLLALAVILFLPIKALAVGDVTVSATSITITKGKTGVFKINANNAAGRVDISSANTAIATVSTSSAFLDSGLAPSTTITVSGKSVGTTTIKVNKTDVATFDNEEKTGSYTITVKVVEPENTTTNTTTNSTKPSTTTKQSKSSSTKTTNTTTKDTKEDTETAKDYSIVELLVQRVERTLNVHDYDVALEIVTSLENSDEKTAFMDRLSTVKPKLLSEEEKTCDCETKDNNIWIILSSILLIILIAENGYLVFKHSMDDK